MITMTGKVYEQYDSQLCTSIEFGGDNMRGNLKLVTVNDRKIIKCPACRKSQRFAKDSQTGIWYPAIPYCCMEMTHNDSPEWNHKLDRLIYGIRGVI